MVKGYVSSIVIILTALFWVQGVCADSLIPADTSKYVINGYLGTQGDRDQVGVYFFEVPETVTSPIYFGINDPSTWSDAPDNLVTSTAGNTTFELYGGSGALSSPDAKLVDYSSNSNLARTGSLLDSFSRGEVDENGWVYFSPVSVTQGEKIGNKYYFKIVVEAGSAGSYDNAYQLAAAYSETQTPTDIEEIRSFFYSALFFIYDTETWNFYPFVPDTANQSTGDLVSVNYDLDSDADVVGTVYDISSTSQGTINKSGNAATAETEFPIGTEVNGTWQLELVKSGGFGQSVEIWHYYDEDGNTGTAGDQSLLRTYSSSFVPLAADAVAVDNNDGLAINDGTDTEQITLQIMDSSGDPVPYSRNVYVSVDGSAQIEAANDTAQTLPASDAVITTDGDGMGWVTVSNTVEETVNVTLVTDGSTGDGFRTSSNLTGADESTTVLFQANPDPEMSSQSNISFSEASGVDQVLPQITLTDSGAADIRAANNIRIQIPSGVGAEFDQTIPTLTITGTASGRVDAAVTYEDSRTLLLSVNSDFLVSETLIINGLELTPPTGGYYDSSGSLQMSVDGGTSYPVVDDKIITIFDPNPTFVWDGSDSDVWSLGANWSGGTAPGAGDNVAIPAGCTNYPVLTAGQTVNNLTIDSGGQIDIGTNTLTVNGSYSNSGTLAGSGALSFGGTQTLTSGFSSSGIDIDYPGNVTIAADITIASGGGAITFGGNLNTDGTDHNLTLDAGTGTVSVAGEFGLTNAFADITITSTGSLNFGGGFGSVVGNNIYFFTPNDADSIAVGTTGSTLDISDTVIAALADGFSAIVIGNGTTTDNAGTGTHAITIDSAAFTDPVYFKAPAGAGSISVAGGLTGTDDASFVLDGSGATTTLSSDILTSGTAVTILDSVLVNGVRTMDTTNGNSADAANITITGAVDGANSGGTDQLTLDAARDAVDGTGDANITLGGNVEGAAGAVSVTGGQDLEQLTCYGNTLDLPNITTTSGPISAEGVALTLSGTAYQTVTTGAVSLTGPVTVTGNTAITSTGGTAITVIGTLAGSGGTETLSLNSSDADGAVDLSAATVSNLGAFTVNAGTGNVTLSSVTAVDGSIQVTGGDGAAGGTVITLNGALTSTGTGAADIISFTGDVDLGAGIAVTSAGGTGDDISFSSTVDGNQTLTLDPGTDGDVNMSGDVGGSTALAGLDVVQGTDVSLESVTTQGGFGTNTIDIGSTAAVSGTVTLGSAGAATLSTAGAGGGTATGNILLNASGQILLTNNMAFISDQGDANGDGSLTLTGGADLVSATGDQGLSFQAASGNISLNNVVMNASAYLDALTVTSGADINLPLIRTNDGGIDVLASGILTLNGDLRTDGLGPGFDTGAVNLHGTGSILLVNSTSLVSSDGGAGLDGSIDIGLSLEASATGAQALTVDAGTSGLGITEPLGLGTRLGLLTLTADTIDINNSVECSGLYAEASTSFDFDSTDVGTFTLDLNGVDSFLNAPVMDAGTDETIASTLGSVLYLRPVTEATVLNLGTASGGITDDFLQAADASLTRLELGYDAAQTVNADLAALNPADQSGPVTWNTTALLSLPTPVVIQAAGATVDMNDGLTVTGGGGFTVNGSGAGTTLNGTITTAGGTIFIDDAVTLGGATTLDTTNSGGSAGAAIEIDNTAGGGTVDNAQTLTLTAGTGTVTVDGNIGSGTALTGFTVNSASQSDLADILVDSGNLSVISTGIDLNGTTYQTTTSGSITFDGAVDLDSTGALSVTTPGGAGDDITLEGTLDDAGSDSPLTMDADNGAGGAVLIGDAVGSTNALSSLTVAAGAALTFEFPDTDMSVLSNGAIDLTAASVILDDDDTLANDGANTLTLDTTGGPANISITGSLDDAGDTTPNGLLLQAGATGDVTCDGAVGASTALGSFDVDSANQVTLQAVTTNAGLLQVGNSTADRPALLLLNGDLTSQNGGAAGNIILHADDQRITANGATDDTLTISTNGTTDGNITVSTAAAGLNSSTAWADGVTLNAGTGTLDLTNATLDSLDHLSVTVASAALGDQTLGDGVGNGGTGFQVTTTGNLTLSGDITMNDGATTTAGAVDLSGVAGSIVLNDDGADNDGFVTISTDAATADASVTLGPVTDGTGLSLQVLTGSSDITLSGAAGTDGNPLEGLTLSGSTINVNDNVDSIGMTLTATTALNIANNLVVDSHNANMVFAAEDIAINTAATAAQLITTGAGSPSLIIRGDDDADSIGLGDLAAGTLNLTQAELETVGAGFGAIEIGNSGLQTGLTTINENGGLVLTKTNLILHADGATGEATLISNLDLSGTAGLGLTINGNGATADPTTLTASILTQDGAVLIDDAVSLGGSTVINTVGGGSGAAITIDSASGSGTINGAESLTLNSGTGGITLDAAIGASTPLADFSLTQDPAFTVNVPITTTGDASITSNTGALTMVDGIDLDAGAGQITLSAANDITLSRLVTTNAAAGAVSITSTSGSILDGGDTGGADIEAIDASAEVSLSSAGNIGNLDGTSVVNAATDPIETTVTNLSAATTGANSEIAIANTGAFTLTNLTPGSANTGHALITGTAGMTVSALTVTNGAASDNVGLEAGGAMTLPAGALDTGTGILRFIAAGAIDDGTDTDFTNTWTAGTLYFQATASSESLTTDINTFAEVDLVTSGNLTINNTGGATYTAIDTASGTITLNDTGDMTVASVNAGTSAVTLATTGGSILDDNAGTNNITGSLLTMNVTGDIGALGDPLETAVDQWDMESANASNFYVTDADNIEIVDIDTAAAGSVTLETTANAIDDHATDTIADITTGTLTLTADTGIGNTATLETEVTSLSANSTTGGDIVLLETAGGGALSVNGATTVAGGDIDIQTTDGALTSTADVITATTGTVTLVSGGGAGDALNIQADVQTANGTLTLTSADALTMNNGTTVESTGTGLIDIDAAGTVQVSDVLTGNTTASAIDINTSVGSLTDADGGAGNDLTVGGGGGIILASVTGSDDLEISAATLTASTSGTGNMTLSETDGITLTSVSLNDGAFDLTAGGDIEAVSVDSGTSGTTLTSTAGEIYGSGGGTHITAGLLTMDAATAIGNTLALNLAVTGIDADTSNGNIDMDNAAIGAVTVTSLSSGAGTINYDQTGGQTMNVTYANTDGDITLTNAGTGGHIVIASGAGQGVIADTADDTVSITSQDGDIAAEADDGDVEIEAFDITLSAVNGSIGAVNSLDINAVNALAADTSTGAGDISLDDITGDLPLGLIDAGGDTVTLTSVGNFTDANGGGNNINAGTLSLSAAGNIGNLDGTSVVNAATDPIETTVTNLSAATTGANSEIAIDNTGALTLTNLTPGSANTGHALITGTAGMTVSALTVTNGAASDNVALEADGAMTLPAGALDTGTGILRFIAAGAIDDGTDTDFTNTWTAGTLYFRATASSESLTTDINTFADVDLLTSGNLTINNSGGGTYTSVSTDDGSITLSDTAASSLLSVDASGTDVEANDISVTLTGGSLTLDGNVTTGGTAGDITLTANNSGTQSIVYSSGTLTADVLTLTARNNIGVSGTPLQTAVNSANLSSTDSGDIALNEADAITLTALDTADGPINVATTGGTITATDVDASGNDVEANDITLTAGGTGNIDVDLITTGGGDGDVILTAAGGAINGSGGVPHITADDFTADAQNGIGETTQLALASVDLIDADVAAAGAGAHIDITNAAAEAVTIASLTTTNASTISYAQTGDQSLALTFVSTANGDITLDNSGGIGADITLGDVSADTTDDMVTVTSSGRINDAAGGGDTTADITAYAVDLDAVEGIGTSAALGVDLADAVTIDADSTGAGAINLNSAASAGVTVNSLSTGTSGAVTLTQTGGQTLAVTSAATATGNITLQNTGAALTAASVLAGGAGAGDGDVFLTTVTSGDVNVDDVQAQDDSVSITSAAAVEESGPDAGADIAAGSLTISSVTGVGASGTLETAVATLDVINSTSGAIAVTDNDALTVTRANQTTVGAITITTAAGNLTVNTNGVTANGADTVTLNAQGGGTDLDIDAALDSGTGLMNLLANNQILLGANVTTSANDIEVNSTTIELDANISLTTGGAAVGDIIFYDPLDSTSGSTLSLTAGTGDVIFAGNVGASQRLGAITIDSATNVAGAPAAGADTGSITAASLTQTAGSGTSRYGALDTNGASGIDLNGNIITLNGGVTTTGGGALSLTNSGLLTITDTAGTADTAVDLNLDGPFLQDGTGDVSLQGDIVTTGDTVDWTGPLTLTGDTALDSGTGANISFADTAVIDNDGAGPWDLILDAPGAAVSFGTTNAAASARIGGAAGANRIDALTITDAATVTFNGEVFAGSLTQSAGTTATVFQQPVNLTGNGDLTGQAVTINNGWTSTGGFLSIANGGTLTLVDSAGANDTAVDISLDGAFTQTGAGAVQIDGDVVTANDNISFASQLSVTGDLSLDTGGAAGDLTLTGGADDDGTGYILTLDAGTGALSVGADVGGTDPFGYIKLMGCGNLSTVGAANLSFQDLYIDADTYTLVLQNAMTLGGRVFFYRGTLNLNGQALTVGEDFVIQGAGYAAVDSQRTTTDAGNSLHAYTDPEGGAVLYDPGTYNAAFTGAGLTGASISVGDDFYNNGTDMNGTGNWTLNLQDNLTGTPSPVMTPEGTAGGNSYTWGNPFNVALNMTVANCAAVTGGAVAASTAANGVTDGAGNMAAGPGTPGWDLDPLTIASVETIYDNILRITFSEAVENSNNEISAAIATTGIAFNTAGEISLDAAYVDSDGTPDAEPYTFTTTDGEGDLTTFYLHVSNATATWNTDATGVSAGAAGSTDRAGVIQTTIPDIDFVKGSFFSAQGKNTVQNYGENGGGAYTGTTDECKPVLIAVEAGRDGADYLAAPPLYDGHNYLHFRYSEPVSIGTMATVDAADENIRAVDDDATGGYMTDIGNSIRVRGYIDYGNGAGVDYSAGTKDATSQIASLYRNGAVNPSGNHGFTLYAAGYATAVDDWPGYIITNTDPVGLPVVTVSENANITDLAANQLADSNDFNPGMVTDPYTGMTITDRISDIAGLGDAMPDVAAIYQGWDVDPPEFAFYAPGASASGSDEIVAEDTNADEQIDQFEIHFEDNSADQAAWDSSSDHTDTRAGYGIRDSSLVDNTAFSFGLNGGTLYNGMITGFTTGTSNRLFDGDGIPPYDVVVDDDSYATVQINEGTYGWDLTVDLEYAYVSATGLMTDLAGNLLPDSTAPCIERTPPRISYATAIVGDDKIFIRFSEPIEWTDGTLDGNDFDDVNIGGGLTITSITPLTVVTGGAVRDLYFNLSGNLTADILLSGTVNAALGKVTDDIGIPMDETVNYSVADIAGGMIEPLWASDGLHDDDLHGGNSGVLRVFDGSGRIMPRDVTLQGQVAPGAVSRSLPVQMIFDMNPPSGVIPGSDLWLPSHIPGLTEYGNNDARTVNPYDVGTNGLRNFLIPQSDSEMAAGKTLEFLFRLGSVYCARAEDPTDPRTLVPWQVDIEDVVRQKGGVTLVNNVINPREGDKAALIYETDQAGMVTAQVFDLAGDLIQILHRGRIAAGEHTWYWNGRNSGGSEVARGVYFLRVVGPGVDEMREIMVVK